MTKTILEEEKTSVAKKIYILLEMLIPIIPMFDAFFNNNLLKPLTEDQSVRNVKAS